ncbi:metallophosphoesterase [Candidatus Berkelbacteria bacterium]|nr:metallophosphoesterase [Candidatus Berkelbacteria bacterium]
MLKNQPPNSVNSPDSDEEGSNESPENDSRDSADEVIEEISQELNKREKEISDLVKEFCRLDRERRQARFGGGDQAVGKLWNPKEIARRWGNLRDSLHRVGARVFNEKSGTFAFDKNKYEKRVLAALGESAAGFIGAGAILFSGFGSYVAPTLFGHFLKEGIDGLAKSTQFILGKKQWNAEMVTQVAFDLKIKKFLESGKEYDEGQFTQAKVELIDMDAEIASLQAKHHASDKKWTFWRKLTSGFATGGVAYGVTGVPLGVHNFDPGIGDGFTNVVDNTSQHGIIGSLRKFHRVLWGAQGGEFAYGPGEYESIKKIVDDHGGVLEKVTHFLGETRHTLGHGLPSGLKNSLWIAAGYLGIQSIWDGAQGRNAGTQTRKRIEKMIHDDYVSSAPPTEAGQAPTPEPPLSLGTPGDESPPSPEPKLPSVPSPQPPEDAVQRTSKEEKKIKDFQLAFSQPWILRKDGLPLDIVGKKIKVIFGRGNVKNVKSDISAFTTVHDQDTRRGRVVVYLSNEIKEKLTVHLDKRGVSGVFNDETRVADIELFVAGIREDQGQAQLEVSFQRPSTPSTPTQSEPQVSMPAPIQEQETEIREGIEGLEWRERLTFEQFKQILDNATALYRHEIENGKPIFEGVEKIDQLQPVAEITRDDALIVFPKDVQVFTLGDLHGDTRVLHSFLKKTDLVAKMQRGEKVALLVLGDMLDRGAQSSELLATLLSLKLAFPKQVVLLRGDHEDVAINCDFVQNARNSYHTKTFGAHEILGNTETEWEKKFGAKNTEIIKNTHTLLYGGLPYAAVLPNGFVATHAGVPYELNRLEAWTTPNEKRQTQFMWGDYTDRELLSGLGDADNASVLTRENPGRVYMFGNQLIRHLKEKFGIQGLVRGHEHDRQPFRNQDSTVFTLVSSGEVVSDTNRLRYGLLQSDGTFSAYPLEFKPEYPKGVFLAATQSREQGQSKLIDRYYELVSTLKNDYLNKIVTVEVRRSRLDGYLNYRIPQIQDSLNDENIVLEMPQKERNRMRAELDQKNKSEAQLKISEIKFVLGKDSKPKIKIELQIPEHEPEPSPEQQKPLLSNFSAQENEILDQLVDRASDPDSYILVLSEAELELCRKLVLQIPWQVIRKGKRRTSKENEACDKLQVALESPEGCIQNSQEFAENITCMRLFIED